MFTAILISIALMQDATPSPPSVCLDDQGAMLALPIGQFDQDPHGGWRPVSEKSGCTEAAADVIAKYRTVNWATLQPKQAQNLYWHEGQLRAYLGQNQRAVGLLMAGVPPSTSDMSFQEYALGTIAFLNRDRKALEAARERLAALPQPPEFAAQAKDFQQRFGVSIRWPKNLDVLDRLLACYDKDYRTAYETCSVDSRKPTVGPVKNPGQS